ncbi:MAG: tRNA1(Val) (adenine(37)-N6)-methyltransferase [Lachnospiraceae bacterium]|nr:tRNA1(Val) (adenine(37)-N6)-methyltransferase [Lachnospiraceae bacterium]
MTAEVHENERVDDLERSHLRIIQDPGRFCFGMDAVLLTGYVRVPQGAQLLDLGTGTGIIPILLSAKSEAEHLTGLELQPESADMAARSVKMNALEHKISIIQGDIREAAGIFDAASFDVVTANPPYMRGGAGLLNPEGSMAIAKHEVCCTLEDVVRAASYCLKEGGIFGLVHRPFRLPDIFEEMRRHAIEPKRMKLVCPYAGREPSLVLIEGRRGGRPQLTVEAPLIIYGPDGVYTEEIREIYGY